MEEVYEFPIGNHFKKENIYLCTINGIDENIIKERFNNVPKVLLDMMINSGIISTQQYDIFYKDENGYTRFLEEGLETFKGDNSDGKGYIENVVPAWDYYKEEELFEAIINGELMIAVESLDPLEKYNEEYNLEGTKKLVK